MTDGNLIDQEDTMEVFLLGLNTVVPIFIMMVAGYILARAGIIDEQMNVDLSKLYNADGTGYCQQLVPRNMEMYRKLWRK